MRVVWAFVSWKNRLHRTRVMQNSEKARKTHEEILEKLCGIEVKILLEFFQNHTKMEAKWYPKWFQRLQEY